GARRSQTRPCHPPRRLLRATRLPPSGAAWLLPSPAVLSRRRLSPPSLLPRLTLPSSAHLANRAIPGRGTAPLCPISARSHACRQIAVVHPDVPAQFTRPDGPQREP